MSSTQPNSSIESALEKLKQAGAEGKLTDGAVENIRIWLTESRYADYSDQVIEHLEKGMWQELDDAFWTIIPFGTGGRRGRMYPIGSNAINTRTIGESAQGLANYLENVEGIENRACAIAYDTRHRSRQFAELCASIMLANGYEIYFLDDYRSTPELSFLVREKNCCCGIMVTASHNPPSDNAVKVYGASGGQLVPPDDRGVIEQVGLVDQIKTVDFEEAVAQGKVHFCKEEIDAALLREHEQQSFAGPRDLKVIYSPLHGVGEFNVAAAMSACKFDDVEIFEPHREPSGDFPNVPEHVSNPENPRVFDLMIERAQEIGADLCLATDPDADRMGAAAPLTLDSSGPWATFTGNQLGVLLTDFTLEQNSKAGKLTADSYVIKTLVTTDMIRRIADSYQVHTHGNLLVGFKWIGQLIDRVGPDRFIFGTEESHGFLVGQYARDKDGVVACTLMAELAAHVKASGQSLHEKLDSLYWQHGYHCEHLVNMKMEGSDGMRRMKALMAMSRETPPKQIGGLGVERARDYLSRQVISANGERGPLNGPQGDLVIFDLAEEGNYIAVRPSGTEPKVKFYMFTYVAAEQLADLDQTKAEMNDRIASFETDLRKLAELV